MVATDSGQIMNRQEVYRTHDHHESDKQNIRFQIPIFNLLLSPLSRIKQRKLSLSTNYVPGWKNHSDHQLNHHLQEVIT